MTTFNDVFKKSFLEKFAAGGDLSVYGYVTQNDMYYEARVDITDAFQSMY